MNRIIPIVLILVLIAFALPVEAGRSVSGTLADARTTTGQDKGANAIPWGNIRFIITITGGTATVKVECLDGGATIVLASVTATSGLVTDYPCEQVATNVTAISGATVNSSFLSTEE